MKTETVMIFCAHSDDEAIGMGGTIARYADAGMDIIKIVFSYGEGSHPHFQESVVISKRIAETEHASRYIGIKKNIFLGLRDKKLNADIEKTGCIDKIRQLIGEYKPWKIFVPSSIDPHPDHRAVNNAVLKAVDGMKKKCPVFEFEVWNVIEASKPMLYIDISNYYRRKVKYMKYFASQWQFIYFLWLPAYFRSRSYGKRNKCRFAEKFYKVR